MPRPNLHREIARHKEHYDWTVIDGTPRDDAITRSCLIAADIVVIPIEPSALSAWASDRTVGQVEEARIYRPDLQARIVISRKIAGTVLGREMRWLVVLLPDSTHRQFKQLAAARGTSMSDLCRAWVEEALAEHFG